MLNKYKRGLRALSTAALLIAASGLNGQSVKWAKQSVGGTGDQTFSDVATDGAGNVYVGGFFKTQAVFNGTTTLTNADATTYEDGYLAKYDRTGTTLLWALQFAQTSGTLKSERVYAVAVYPDGQGSFELFVVGTYTSTLTLLSNTAYSTYSINLTAGSGQSGFIAKYDANGVLQWGYKIDGSGADIVYDVCVSPDGSGGKALYVAGSFGGSSIACTGSSSTPVTVSSISTNTEAFMMSFTDAGTTAAPAWGRGMGSSGNDGFYSIASAENGDVVVTGQIKGAGSIHNGTGTTAVSCSGVSDIVVARYDKNGNFTYVVNGGGSTGNDAGLAAAIDVNGDAYVAGYFCGTCVFTNCTTSVVNLAGGSSTTWDFFIAKIDPSGNNLWLKSGGTSNDQDAIQSIVVNNLASRVYVAGNFKGSLSYDGSGTLFNSGTTSNIDGFLLTADASSGASITSGYTWFGGSDYDDNGRAIAINAAEDIFVGCSASSSNWGISGATSGSQYFANSGTGGTYESAFLRWDHSNWPAAAGTNSCLNKGIGEWWDASANEWKVSMGGFYNSSGTIAFGSNNLPASTSSGQDAYIATCNSFGVFQSVTRVMDGTAEEIVADHTTDASGNNYFTGYGAIVNTQVYSFVGGGTYTASTTGVTAGFLGKYSSAAGYTWGVFFTPNASISEVHGRGVAVDDNGYVYVTGDIKESVTFGSTNTTGTNPAITISGQNYDIFALKYDASGNLIWAKRFGSTSAGAEKGYSISVDNDPTNPAYYITGEYNTTGTLTFGSSPALGSTGGNTDIFVMKGNASSGGDYAGISASISNADVGNDVISPTGSECYITGSGNNNTVCFTGSVDFSGTPSWNWTYTNTGTASAVGTDLVLGNNGYLFVSGYTRGTGATSVTFGSFTENANDDAFLVSFSSWAGVPVCLNVYGYGVYNTTEAIALETGANSPDHGDNVLVAGSKGANATNHISYATKLTTEGCALSERRPNPQPAAVTLPASSGSFVYPNPLNNRATLEIHSGSDISLNPVTIIITDMTGREINRLTNVSASLVEINAEAFADGIYLYQVIQNNNMISNGKMIVNH